MVNRVRFGAVHRHPISLVYLLGIPGYLPLLVTAQKIRRLWRICVYCPVNHDIGIHRIVRGAIRGPPRWKHGPPLLLRPLRQARPPPQNDDQMKQIHVTAAIDRILGGETR